MYHAMATEPLRNDLRIENAALLVAGRGHAPCRFSDRVQPVGPSEPTATRAGSRDVLEQRADDVGDDGGRSTHG